MANKLAIPGLPMSSMPLEWLEAGSWRLPSGKALAEFALQAGFLAPLLFNVDQFGGDDRDSGVEPFLGAPARPSRAKHCGKVSGQ
jgi:hypothetical protein